jgi:hypothetical protein
MSCLWTQWRLSRRADGAPMSTRARAHLARCATCRALEHQLETLDRALRTAADQAPPPRPTSPPRRGRSLAWAGAASLGVAAAAALMFASGPTRVPSSARPPVTATAPEPRSAPPLTPAPAPAELDRLRADARNGLRFVLRVSGLPPVSGAQRSM